MPQPARSRSSQARRGALTDALVGLQGPLVSHRSLPHRRTRRHSRESSAEHQRARRAWRGGAAPWVGRERPAVQAVWPRCREQDTRGALDPIRYEDMRLVDHSHIVGDGVARTTGAGSPAYRTTTLNQRRATRAKSAPVQARIVRFLAVNSGFGGRAPAAANPLNPAQRCGKRLRQAKDPGAGKGCDFLDGRKIDCSRHNSRQSPEKVG